MVDVNWQYCCLPPCCHPVQRLVLQVLELDMEQLSLDIQSIDTKIAATKPNMAAIEEYNRKQKVGGIVF